VASAGAAISWARGAASRCCGGTNGAWRMGIVGRLEDRGSADRGGARKVSISAGGGFGGSKSTLVPGTYGKKKKSSN